MATSGYFSAGYGEARRKFHEAASQAGARLTSYIMALEGPRGEPLATDVAWLGPVEATRVLMTISGTHGIEGFCGSGAQIGSFAAGIAQELPPDTALLVIHAINPYGFAWLRRVTEGNIDLNRNFVDFTAPLPRNEGYIELADALCPADWNASVQAATLARLEDYNRRHGAAALQRAVTGGQYTHPDGIFYGGAAPSPSRRLLLRIAADHLKSVRYLGIIDFHSGLGPYGHGELIVSDPPESPGFARARAWYGDNITSTSLGTSTSSDLSGDILPGLGGAFPGIEATGVALEYGVRPLLETLEALRGDNWLHCHGRLDSAQGRDIKGAMRDAFYGDADDWKDMVLEQAIAAQRQALRGLGD